MLGVGSSQAHDFGKDNRDQTNATSTVLVSSRESHGHLLARPVGDLKYPTPNRDET